MPLPGREAIAPGSISEVSTESLSTESFSSTDSPSTDLSAWYADFFTELPNAFWRAAVPPEATSADVDLFVRETGLGAGSRVLDVPCGSGRHTLELARRGCRVTGLDVSAEAIGHARGLAADEGLDVDLRVGDMRTLPDDLEGSVDTACCLGNSFGYLEHEATVAFLEGLARIVRPVGGLVIDSGFVAESLLPGLSLEEPPMELGGVTAVSENEYDVALGRWITRFTFRRGDEVQHGTTVQYLYTAAEVSRMVTAAGFTDVRLFGDADGTPYALGSPRLLLVARRL
jgi:SAM-dependent methyltransferase